MSVYLAESIFIFILPPQMTEGSHPLQEQLSALQVFCFLLLYANEIFFDMGEWYEKGSIQSVRPGRHKVANT